MGGAPASAALLASASALAACTTPRSNACFSDGLFHSMMAWARRRSRYFNTSPALSPNGDKLAFISDRDDYRSVYVLDVNNPRRVKEVVQGEENVDFEEIDVLPSDL